MNALDFSGQFREALSRWASGVTVVAVRLSADEVKAATATAFCSVSLEPPLVLVSLSHASRTLEAASLVRRFTVNLLASTQEEHSRKYGSPIEPPQAPFVGEASIDGALASIVCTVHELHPAGDHTLVIGRVESISLGEQPDEPLLYFKRNYRALR
ncbi:MAG: flavin reductase family protein [Polyangiaceae bacterium]